jgi:hypothetical protein
MLKRRWFERDKDQIKMFSQHDHSDVLSGNYTDRMSGDKGYIDQGEDLMRVARIPIAFLASLTNEQKLELEHEPGALMKLLDQHPEFRTNTARL